MHPLYEKLYALLDRFGVKTPEDVLKLGNKSAGEFTFYLPWKIHQIAESRRS
jgi:hypothetical protein